MVGRIDVQGAEKLSTFGYENTAIKKLAPKQGLHTAVNPKAFTRALDAPIIHKRRVDESVKNLGADIRNDLNNPLQEIVAMVFVAKASGQSETADKALEAISNAAQNMAVVVSTLEDKIRGIVNPSSRI